MAQYRSFQISPKQVRSKMRNRREFKENRRGHSGRKIGNRNIRQRFLIVCEGEKTEPNYFKSFRTAGLVVDAVGLGANTLSLVRKAAELAREGDYDQVWCVFDRDSFSPEQFNEALALARRSNIQVAYSNEAFEIWYMLHFNYYDAGLGRADYRRILTELLGEPYEKNSTTMFERLRTRLTEALRNAKRLFESYEPSNPERDKPSTTVHLLVEELLRHSRK